MKEIRRVQLSEIAELITKGTTPTTLGYGFQEEGVNFLKIECFDENGDFIEDKVTHISEECHEKLKRSQLKAGDVLFSIAGAIGRVAIVTEEMLPANTNQALAIIRIKDEQVYLPFIKLILTSPIVVEQFERKKQGVAQLNLSLKDINEISIPLPSIDEQIELAELFGKVSGVIAKRNIELIALDELIKARFVELFGDAQTNPKNWGYCTVNDVIESSASGWSGNGKQREKLPGEIAVLKVSAVTKGYFIPEECKVLDDQNNIKKYVYPEKGDLIFSRANTREMVGSTAVIENDYPEHILPDKLWKIRINDKASVYYVKGILTTPHIREVMSSLSTGTSGSMYNLSFEKFKGIRIMLPPIEMQQQYEDFIKQVDKSKVVVQQALDKAQLLFDSLMQEYFG